MWVFIVDWQAFGTFPDTLESVTHTAILCNPPLPADLLQA